MRIRHLIIGMLPLLLLNGCNDKDNIPGYSQRGDRSVSANTPVPPGVWRGFDRVGRFAVLGDVGRGSSGEKHLARLVTAWDEREELNGVLLVGDNIYSDSDYSSDSEKKLFDPLTPILQEGIHIYSVLGNHDHQSGFAEAETSDRRLGMRGNTYYRIADETGLYSIYMLDSETLEDDKDQQNWLAENLAKDNAIWLICVMHIPPFASEVSHGGSERLIGVLQDAFPPNRSFDLYVSGHNHVYERRSVPKLSAVAVVQGASGRVSQEDWPEDPDRLAKYDEDETYMALEITESSIKGAAINTEGIAVDEFTIPTRSTERTGG